MFPLFVQAIHLSFRSLVLPFLHPSMRRCMCLCMCLCYSIFMSGLRDLPFISWSVCLSACSHVCRFLCLFVSSCSCASVCSSVSLPLCVSLSLSFCLSLSLSLSPSLSLCLSVFCLSVSRLCFQWRLRLCFACLLASIFATTSSCFERCGRVKEQSPGQRPPAEQWGFELAHAGSDRVVIERLCLQSSGPDALYDLFKGRNGHYGNYYVLAVNGQRRLQEMCDELAGLLLCIWLREIPGMETAGVEVPSHNGIAFETSRRLTNRTDAYFGLHPCKWEGKEALIFHCSSFATGAIKTSGNVQYATVARCTGTLSLPSDKALDRDQAAHNMCFVDERTGQHLSLNFMDGPDIPYATGGQYDALEQDFKTGVFVYSLVDGGKGACPSKSGSYC